jgi:Tfp pilus assembly protein PilF
MGISFLALGLAIFLSSCASGEKKKELTSTERARLFVDLANGALNEGDPTGCLQHLVTAEGIDRSLPELHHTRALAFHVKKDTTRALISARKAVELDEHYSDAKTTLGRLLMESGRNSEAIPYLETAAGDALYRDSFKAATNLGILHYRNGDYSKASVFLKKAVQDSPLRACHAYFYLGHIGLKQGRFEEAARSYDRATQKFCASFGDAHVALGIAYERGRKYDLARKKFLDIQSAFPGTKFADQAVEHLKFLP